MKNVLVIAAHPDDETLGCGGTLLKLKEEKVNISWLIYTNINEEDGYDRESVSQRQKEIESVKFRYGFKNVYMLNLPTKKLDTISKGDIISQISKIMVLEKPDTIFLQNRSDIHSDHHIVFETTMACTKSFRAPYIKTIFLYETISETEFAPSLPENVFIPNFYSDITEFIEEKIDIMKIYKGEMGEHPFPRSERNIKALATFRGAIAGVEYAESFMCIKGTI